MPDTKLALLKEGSPATVTLTTGETIEGKVRFVSPRVNLNTSLGRARIGQGAIGGNPVGKARLPHLPGGLGAVHLLQCHHIHAARGVQGLCGTRQRLQIGLGACGRGRATRRRALASA